MNIKKDYFGLFKALIEKGLAKPATGYEDIEAAIYDLDQPIFPGEIEFYGIYAKVPHKPILELGCGAGRLLIPLAEKGFIVTGVEISEDMLDICRRKVELLQTETKSRITLIKRDMCKVNLSDKFQLIIMGGKTFQFAVTTKQKLDVLKVGRKHLTKNGAFIIDSVNPWALPEPSGISSALVDLGENKIALRIWECKYDKISGETLLNILTIPFKKDMVSYPTVSTFRGRVSTIQEMKLLVKQVGLTITETFSDFDKHPLSQDSQNVIYVLKN